MVMEKDDQAYLPLAHDDIHSSNSDGDGNESHESLFSPHRSYRGSHKQLLRLLEVLIVAVSLSFGIFGFVQVLSGESSFNNACPIEPFFRPETEQITDNNFSWTQHLSGSESDIYMGKPTLAREAAWKDLLQNRVFSLTAVELEALNLTGEIPSLVGEHTGSGTALGYNLMSGVDYELRCLSLIRQWSYWDHYSTQMDELPEVYYSSPEDAHALIDSCLETLRLQIFCASNSMRFLVPNATSISGYRTPVVLRNEESQWQCARKL